MEDRYTEVLIPFTNRVVKIGWIKPYTIERLTALWVEREMKSVPTNDAETLKSMCKEPYFCIKEACLFYLNGAFRIKFLYPIVWRIWAYLRNYTDEQMMPIIQEGKKKIPLTAHWTIMAYSADMRTDWKNLTEKEAEQYRAELLSVVNRLSSKDSQSTDDGGGASAVGATDAD